MKKILLIIAGVVLVGLIAAGSFWGGMKYQSSQTSQARDRFIQMRGEGVPGQMPFDAQNLPEGAVPFSGTQGGGFGGGTIGTIKTIDGNMLTISTAEDVTTVNLSDDTLIQQMQSISLADLAVGMRVRISGERDKDGNLTAVQIMIINDDLPGAANPYPGSEGP
jgi:hypothetical protein